MNLNARELQPCSYPRVPAAGDKLIGVERIGVNAVEGDFSATIAGYEDITVGVVATKIHTFHRSIFAAT